MDEVANTLVQAFADFANEQTPDAPRLQAVGLRWEVRNERFPPCVVIIRRGKRESGKSNVVATISNSGAFAHLYPSWQPVIKDWLSKRIANAGKRTNHAEFATGETPNE